MSDAQTNAQPALLKGKVASITGGLTGIGRAIAIGFLRQGASVAINYLGGAGDDAFLQELLSDIEPHQENFIAIAGDVSEPETGKALVKGAVDRWGRLDIFVSNAGICTFADFLESIALANLRRQMPILTLLARQAQARPLLQDRPHEPRWLILLHASRSSPDGVSIASRWFHHRHLLYLCTAWRRPPDALYAYESGDSESDAELCGSVRQV